MATGEPKVRPWRTPPSSVSSSTSKRWRGPRPYPRRRRASSRLDVLDRHLQAGREPFDDHDQPLAVGLTGGEEAQHRGQPTRSAAGELGQGQRRASARGRAADRSTAPAAGPPDGRASRARRRPGTHDRERRPAAASRAGGTRGRRRPGRVAAARGRTAASEEPRPTDVALTTTSAAGMSSARRSWRSAASRTASSARSGVRLTTTISPAPARPTASITLRAAPRRRPPPPPPHRRGRRPPLGQGGDEAVTVGAVADQAAVVRDGHRVDRPQRRRGGASSSTAAATSSLCGVVTESPRNPRTRIASSAAPAVPGATSKATYTQSKPADRKAALWIAGDSEWATGEPITAATFIPATGGRSLAALLAHASGRQSTGRRRRRRDVGGVLLTGGGEGVSTILVGEDVVEVLALHVVGQVATERVADARVRRRVQARRGSTLDRDW